MRPVILLEKLPVPEPLVVWLLFIVGLGRVSQQTPRAVTAAPPVLMTLPPLTADVSDILLAVVVVTVGKFANVVTVISLP